MSILILYLEFSYYILEDDVLLLTHVTGDVCLWQIQQPSPGIIHTSCLYRCGVEIGVYIQCAHMLINGVLVLGDRSGFVRAFALSSSHGTQKLADKSPSVVSSVTHPSMKVQCSQFKESCHLQHNNNGCVSDSAPEDDTNDNFNNCKHPIDIVTITQADTIVKAHGKQSVTSLTSFHTIDHRICLLTTGRNGYYCVYEVKRTKHKGNLDTTEGSHTLELRLICKSRISRQMEWLHHLILESTYHKRVQDPTSFRALAVGFMKSDLVVLDAQTHNEVCGCFHDSPESNFFTLLAI